MVEFTWLISEIRSCNSYHKISFLRKGNYFDLVVLFVIEVLFRKNRLVFIWSCSNSDNSVFYDCWDAVGSVDCDFEFWEWVWRRNLFRWLKTGFTLFIIFNRHIELLNEIVNDIITLFHKFPHGLFILEHIVDSDGFNEMVHVISCNRIGCSFPYRRQNLFDSVSEL